MKTAEEYAQEYYQLDKSGITSVRITSAIKFGQRYHEYASQFKKLPTLEESGAIVLSIIENVNPKLSEKEQALIVAGFQECIKYLSQFKTVDPTTNCVACGKLVDSVFKRDSSIRFCNCKTVEPEEEEESDEDYEIDPCPTCGQVEGMVNPCCANYDPLNYKVCGYG
jgi:hypothetical protein